MDPLYFRGVGIGLLIAWVTGAIAYLRTGGAISAANFRNLIVLEAVVSTVMIALGYVL